MHARLEREAEALGAPRDEIALLPRAAQRRCDRAERAAQAGQRLRRQRAQVGLAQAPAAAAGHLQRAEQDGAVALERVQRPRRLLVAVADAGALGVAREQHEVDHPEARAQPLGGRVLELVRLVEDDRVVVGQDRHGAVRDAAQAEVGEVEGVVDQHHLRLGGQPPRALAEALVDDGAARAAAAVGTDGQLGPELRRRLDRQLGPVARGGLGRATAGSPPAPRRSARRGRARRRRRPAAGRRSWRGP